MALPGSTQRARSAVVDVVESPGRVSRRLRGVGPRTFLGDDRGQAIQVGAVLVFGILVVLLALYQGVVVPDQNEEVELDHSQEVRAQLTELRATAVSMPGATTTRSVTVDLGVRYPPRTVFANPGPASGTLETVGTTDPAYALTIENATADGAAGDFWDGTARSYNTGALEYRPGYNLLPNAPRTVYEHGVLYDDFGDATLPVTDQAMVSDDRITLVTLNGSVSEHRVDSVAVDFEPVSTDTRTVEIESADDDSPVTLSVPTAMNESEWEEVFADELQDGYVERVSTEPAPDGEFSLLTVTLAPGETYTLQLANVGVGTGIEGTEPAYLTDVAGDGTVQRGETGTLEVEVRDAFNNPVSGVTVEGFAEGGVFADSGTDQTEAETDSEGRIAVDYEGQAVGTHGVDFSIDYAPAEDVEHQPGTPGNITMTVDVEEPPEEKSTAFDVTWDEGTIAEEPGVEKRPDGVLEYDVSEAVDATGSQKLTLTALTDAETDGATIEYAVSDSGVGTVEGTDVTSGGAETTTAFDPGAEGTVEVFVSGGGSGDRLELEVTNISE